MAVCISPMLATNTCLLVPPPVASLPYPVGLGSGAPVPVAAEPAAPAIALGAPATEPAVPAALGGAPALFPLPPPPELPGLLDPPSPDVPAPLEAPPGV